MSAVAGDSVAEQPLRRRVDGPVAAIALVAGMAGWWWSIRMATHLGPGAPGAASTDHVHHAMVSAFSFGTFLAGWTAMMAAMMFPAVAPVLSLYRRAAARGRLAPVPFFAAGYLAVWAATAAPAFAAWRALQGPLAGGAAWTARLAAVALLTAAVWQVTPLKFVCLRHCRSPLSFFLRQGGRARHPLGAMRMGATHGLFCVGCCWALMGILVALGTMHPGWMVLLAGLIFAEKNLAAGERVALAAGALLATGAIALLVEPDLLPALR